MNKRIHQLGTFHLLLVTLLCLLPFSLFAADAATASAPAAFKLSTWQWLIPVIVPFVIAITKQLWPTLPRTLIPFLCPFLGLLADFIGRAAGGSGAPPEISAALGALGLFLRELVDQSKKQIFGPADSAGNMKVMFAALACFACFAGNASAAQPSTPRLSTSAKDTIVVNDELFRAGEVSVDFGTAFATADLDTFQSSTAYAVNWFPWREVGFFGEGRTESLTHSTVDDVAFGLLGRLPLETLHLAPHFKLGGDFDFERNEWEAFAAVGAELRLNRHVGFVGEVRGVRPVHDASKEYLQFVVSLRGIL